MSGSERATQEHGSPSTRSESADAIAVIIYAVAALAVVGITTLLRALDIFRPVGVAWTIAIDEMQVDATVDSGARSIEGVAGEALVIAPEVDPVSAAAIIGALALWAIAALVVAGSVILIAANFLRGRFFVLSNVRALDVSGWTLVIAPLMIVMLENVGQRGVLAAVGLGDGDPVHPIEFWAVAPSLAIGVTVGLIAVAFRRGIRTQHENATLRRETEGLV